MFFYAAGSVVQFLELGGLPEAGEGMGCGFGHCVLAVVARAGFGGF